MSDNYIIIFKILTQEEWSEFKNIGEFKGTNLDIRDGYIHMSKNMEQVNRIKNKYYKDSQVILLHINSLLLPFDNFKYDSISNGDTYPHLYNVLKMNYVIKYELI
jgi:uncharacterized protein (DUF952 family)